MNAAAADLFASTAEEDWLANRLTQLRADLAVSSCGSRKELLKHVIETQGYEMVIAGRREDGRPETFAEVWERIYGELFHVKQPNRRPIR